jgi:hypothetical protein
MSPEWNGNGVVVAWIVGGVFGCVQCIIFLVIIHFPHEDEACPVVNITHLINVMRSRLRCPLEMNASAGGAMPCRPPLRCENAES